jgi:hypothetical protein
MLGKDMQEVGQWERMRPYARSLRFQCIPLP